MRREAGYARGESEIGGGRLRAGRAVRPPTGHSPSSAHATTSRGERSRSPQPCEQTGLARPARGDRQDDDTGASGGPPSGSVGELVGPAQVLHDAFGDAPTRLPLVGGVLQLGLFDRVGEETRPRPAPTACRCGPGRTGCPTRCARHDRRCRAPPRSRSGCTRPAACPRPSTRPRPFPSRTCTCRWRRRCWRRCCGWRRRWWPPACSPGWPGRPARAARRSCG